MFSNPPSISPPPLRWQADIMGAQPAAAPPATPLSTQTTTAAAAQSTSSENVSAAWRHIEDVVSNIGKEYDLMDLLTNVEREETYQFHPAGVSARTGIQPRRSMTGVRASGTVCGDHNVYNDNAPANTALLYALLLPQPRCLSHLHAPPPSQWPSPIRVLSPQMSNLPGMVLDKYRTAQTMCFCGVFPEIKRAWASIDNSLFLWRYEVP